MSCKFLGGGGFENRYLTFLVQFLWLSSRARHTKIPIEAYSFQLNEEKSKKKKKNKWKKWECEIFGSLVTTDRTDKCCSASKRAQK